MLYLNVDIVGFARTSFTHVTRFFNDLMEQFLIKWNANINLLGEPLTFVVDGETLYAMHCGAMV